MLYLKMNKILTLLSIHKKKNNITGAFINTTNSMTCWYRYFDFPNETFTPCNEIAGFNVHDNGYVEVLIKKEMKQYIVEKSTI